MPNNPEVRIIHDHTHLKALLGDLERTLSIWSEASLSDPAPLDDITGVLDLLKDDTYEHFEREEHGLFPNLQSEFPELAEDIQGLLKAHDEICQALEELERMVTLNKHPSPEQRARTVAFGLRLGQLYWQHTAVEWEMIRDLLERLDDDRRAIIEEQLKEVS